MSHRRITQDSNPTGPCNAYVFYGTCQWRPSVAASAESSSADFGLKSNSLRKFEPSNLRNYVDRVDNY